MASYIIYTYVAQKEIREGFKQYLRRNYRFRHWSPRRIPPKQVSKRWQGNIIECSEGANKISPPTSQKIHSLEPKYKNKQRWKTIVDDALSNQSRYKCFYIEIMNEPMTIPQCGHSFEKKTIYSCLNKNPVCPLCRKPTSI